MSIERRSEKIDIVELGGAQTIYIVIPDMVFSSLNEFGRGRPYFINANPYKSAREAGRRCLRSRCKVGAEPLLTRLEVYNKSNIQSSVSANENPRIRPLHPSDTPTPIPKILTVKEHVHGFGFLAVIPNDDARASNDLAGVALAVDLAEAGPLAELLSVRNLDQVDIVLGAEGLDELDILLLRACLDKDRQMGLAPIWRR
ncbi:hypothetical protein BC936DRAFT_140867 [Jimgerdemannia flammicorona]|uniref:Uncharacterized protein n=1 Tax=Jimgerdemannia flammicorona TaxID=994334 RepID=A0A433A397_9FUNG|nr:hypothetical protein BC936DRAFT_140867 [Jimgerdemannia flammicorona]